MPAIKWSEYKRRFSWRVRVRLWVEKIKVKLMVLLGRG